MQADRLRPAAAPEPAVHARHQRLAVRRRLDQPDVLAGAPARDAEPRGRLPLPPALRGRRFEIWYGGFDHNWGTASIEGGDMMPAGNGVVLVGMGERSTAKAVSILAQNMFAKDAARLVVGAQMPRERAAMHLDTVFTFCDRDVVTIYEPVVDADPPDPVHARTATAASRPRSPSDVPRRRPGRARDRAPDGRHRPAATSSRPSASSGTTATTSSRSRPASSSATSATRRRSGSWRRRASRSARSPARSSAAAAAAATA